MSGALSGEALGGMQHWEIYYIYLQHILLREGGRVEHWGRMEHWQGGTLAG